MNGSLPPQRIIMDISPFGLQFMTDYVMPYATQLGDDVRGSKRTAIYQEILRQIFEIMSEDLSEFGSNLKSLPHVPTVVGYHYLTLNPSVLERLRMGTLEFGMGVFFTLREQGYFNLPNAYILDQPAVDHVVLYLAD